MDVVDVGGRQATSGRVIDGAGTSRVGPGWTGPGRAEPGWGVGHSPPGRSSGLTRETLLIIPI